MGRSAPAGFAALTLLLLLAPGGLAGKGDSLEPWGSHDLLSNGPLEVDEAEIRAAAEDGGLRVTIPVAYSSPGDVEGVAGVELLSLGYGPDPMPSGETSIRLSPGENTVSVFLAGVSDRALRSPVSYCLAWSVRAGDPPAVVEGVRSLAEAIPRLRVLLTLPSEPKSGTVAGFRATVMSFAEGIVVPDARVRLFLHDSSSGDGTVVFDGLTDETGTVSGTIPVQEDEKYLWVRLRATRGPALADLDRSLRIAKGEAEEGRLLLTTDKPLYQPGQTVHLRVLALRDGDLRPAAREPITLSVRDPRGTLVQRQESTLDDFGVAHAELPLAEELLLGDYTFEARGKELSNRKTFTVDRYELPRLSISVRTDADWTPPGEVISGEVEVRYVFGAPARRARVLVESLYDPDSSHELDADRATTDGEGIARFEVRGRSPLRRDLLAGASTWLRVQVTDTAGQQAIAIHRVPISAGPLRLRLVPEAGEIVPGAPNRLHLVVSDPAGRPVESVCDLSQAGSTLGRVVTDSRGHALLVATLPGPGDIDVVATAVADGRTVSESFYFKARQGAWLLLRPAVAMARVGDRLRVGVESSVSEGEVILELFADGRPTGTSKVMLTDGAGEAELLLGPEAVGLVTIAARLLDGEGRLLTDRRTVVVDPGGDLKVEVSPDSRDHRPGDDAALDVAVTGTDARGVPAEVGLTVVDEAVWLLARSRGAAVPLSLSRSRVTGSETLGSDLALVDLLRGERGPRDQDLAAAILAAAGAGEKEVDSIEDEQFELRYSTEWSFQDAANEVAARLRKMGKRKRRESIAAGLFADPWGTPYRLGMSGKHGKWVEFLSAGPDERFGTEDDVAFDRGLRRWRCGRGMCSPALVTLYLAGDTSSPPAPPSVDAGAPTPETDVRRWFPETLLAVPDLRTDAAGRARLPFSLADSITTWRVVALASTEDGALATGTAAIRVTKEVFVDLGLPPRLTRGDRFSLPVLAYNLTEAPREVIVRITAADGFALEGPAEAAVLVPPGEPARVLFPVRVLETGTRTVRAEAVSGAYGDAVEMETRVAPQGRRVAFVRSGRLEEEATEAIEIPLSADPDEIRMSVRILPGVVAQTLDGLDDLVREPYGCFEQTSSVVWPMALALSYMEAAGDPDPDIVAEARRQLAKGYQRLLRFEVGSGAFSLWGHYPARPVLTAYALRVFTDLAKVRTVDPDLLGRIAARLRKIQKADGAWQVKNGTDSETLRRTAWIAWALLDSGREIDAVEAALGYLRDRSPAEEDLYARVLAANALLAADPRDPTGLPLLAGIVAAREEDERGVFWGYGAVRGRRGITASGGRAANVETTALATHALLATEGSGELVSEALRFLAGRRADRGGFGSTHATAWALRSFLAAEPVSSGSTPGTATVAVNGTRSATFDLTGADRAVARAVDVSHLARRGANEVTLTASSGAAPFYVVSGECVVPWEDPSPEPEALAVSVEVKPRNTRVHRKTKVVVRVRNTGAKTGARQVTVEVPLPPGLVPDERDLDAEDDVLRHEVGPGGVTLYLPDIEEGEERVVRFRAYPSLTGEFEVPGAVAWEYYEPASRGTAEPLRLRVR